MSTVYVCDICGEKFHEPPEELCLRGTYTEGYQEEPVEFTRTFVVTPGPHSIAITGKEDDYHVCHDCVLRAVRDGEFWDGSSSRWRPVHGLDIRSAAGQSADLSEVRLSYDLGGESVTRVIQGERQEDGTVIFKLPEDGPGSIVSE